MFPSRRFRNPLVVAGGLLLGQLTAAAPWAGAQSANFGSFADPCPAGAWGNLGPVGTVGGLDWFGAEGRLDTRCYLGSFDPSYGTVQSGYPDAVVLLAAGPLWVQSSSFDLFHLSSLTVGSGWTNGVGLTLRGYDQNLDQQVLERTITLDATAGPQQWLIGGDPIRFFTISVDWGLGTIPAPAWDFNGAPLMWATDPYNSRLYKRDADAFALSQGAGNGPDGAPYLTYYVASVTTATVPEPGTYALMATGVVGLGVALRRRRTERSRG